jgi:hypothetical protein
MGFTARNGRSFLLSFVGVAIGGSNVGRTRFRYCGPSANASFITLL